MSRVEFAVIRPSGPVVAGDTVRLRIALADSSSARVRSYTYYWGQIKRGEIDQPSGHFLVPSRDGRGDVSFTDIGPSTSYRTAKWIPPPVVRLDTLVLRACVDADGGKDYYIGTCQSFLMFVARR